LTIATGVVGLYVTNYIRIVRKQRKILRDIEFNADTTVAAMKIAQARVEERMRHGHYNGKNIKTMLNDFEFETIIEANNME